MENRRGVRLNWSRPSWIVGGGGRLGPCGQPSWIVGGGGLDLCGRPSWLVGGGGGRLGPGGRPSWIVMVRSSARGLGMMLFAWETAPFCWPASHSSIMEEMSWANSNCLAWSFVGSALFLAGAFGRVVAWWASRRAISWGQLPACNCYPPVTDADNTLQIIQTTNR